MSKVKDSLIAEQDFITPDIVDASMQNALTTLQGHIDTHLDYIYPNTKNLAKLGDVLTLLPIHIIKKCLVEMDHIYAISNSTNLDLALSITEENKEATLKMLKLRGW